MKVRPDWPMWKIRALGLVLALDVALTNMEGGLEALTGVMVSVVIVKISLLRRIYEEKSPARDVV